MDNSLFSRIAQAGMNPTYWDEVLPAIANEFDDATLYLCQESLERFGAGDIWTYKFDRVVWERMILQTGTDAWWEPSSNIAIQSVIDAPLRKPIDRRQFISDKDFDYDDLSRILLGSQDLFHVVLSAIQRDNGVISAFWIGRGKDDGPIEGDELRKFELISANIGVAMEAHRRFTKNQSENAALNRQLSEVESRNTGLKHILDCYPDGVILLDKHLKIHYANSEAERILLLGDGLGERNRRLVVSRRYDSALRGMAYELSDAARHQFSKLFSNYGLRIPRSKSKEPLNVLLSAAVGGDKVEISAGASVLMYVTDPSRDSGPRSAMTVWLMEHFGLTRRQSQVSVSAYRGLTINEIAEQDGVSRSTIKDHLKAVYRELGVNGQVELIRYLSIRIPIKLQHRA